MMFYLGQACTYKPYVNSPKLPAILVGYSTDDRPLITYLKENGELMEKDKVFKQDISFVSYSDLSSRN